MADFNPARLILARKRRGLSKKALADAAEVSTRSLTAYEAGQQEPGVLTRLRLADAVGFPVEFLGRDDLEEPPLNATSFRALSRLTAKQRDQALGSASLAIALSDWIEARFSLPEPDVPQLRGVDPETAAEFVRKTWGLGQRPIGNMVHMLEAHGVRVFSLVEECREVDAFSFQREGMPYVFLNTIKSAERSRQDGAHELGHLVLHSGHELPRSKNAENEAQAFGSAFLMPRSSVLAEAPRGGRLDQLVHAKRRWKVSVANLAHRMHKLGLLTDWEYRTLFIEMGEMGYRHSEPQGIDRENSLVFTKVFSALRDEGISKADIAHELAIPSAELTKTVFGLVLTPLAGEATDPAVDHGRPDLRII